MTFTAIQASAVPEPIMAPVRRGDEKRSFSQVLVGIYLAEEQVASLAPPRAVMREWTLNNVNAP
jgi:hypothetical protein